MSAVMVVPVALKLEPRWQVAEWLESLPFEELFPAGLFALCAAA